MLVKQLVEEALAELEAADRETTLPAAKVRACAARANLRGVIEQLDKTTNQEEGHRE